MCDEDNSGGVEEDHGGDTVLIRIYVPDINIHKCLQFCKNDLVWYVKQQCLHCLPKELKESFNYGLFAPPCNGKAGKFLDEERPISEYPFSGPVGYLEMRYKRRLYKGLTVDEKQLKSLHTKSNLKRFLDYVSSGHTEKVSKMCGKGLDPNFHCLESGETPLTIAAVMKKSSKLLMALVNGGALLDYRAKDGSTAMHRAVEAKSVEAVKTMLDLGASPNYKDAKGLTPLYISVATNADPTLTEVLLHDHAFIGAQDPQGWHETHQACRNGLVHHLEHLLYYGADLNAKNASGNTPLHVCAVNNQESCARLLLFRGASKESLNFANQTPYQVAVIAGNMELAEMIQSYRQQDVVCYRDLPKYNPKRRSVVLPRAFSISDSSLRGSVLSMITASNRCSRSLSRGPPSPCPSSRSLLHSSASSSVSECSSHSSVQTNASYSDSTSFSGGSHFGSEGNSGSAMTDKSLDHGDITSDSSGVGTGGSGSGSSCETTSDIALILPGMLVICTQNYSNEEPDHLTLVKGDIIEVTASTDSGFLEGTLRGQVGFFPLSVVQEIRMKPYENKNQLMPPLSANGKSSNQSVKTYVTKNVWGEPHTEILHRGQKGFGFVLRGAKSDSPLMNLKPGDRFPALQYLDDVDDNGVADRAGLKKGDFILAINGTDVSQLSHEVVVDLIRKSGDLVSITVIGLTSPGSCDPREKAQYGEPGSQGFTHYKQGSPASLTCDQNPDGSKAQYHFATLPRKFSAGSTGPIVPSPPRRDPGTSLSVGRARAKSMVAALAELGVGQNLNSESTVAGKSNSVDSIPGKPPLPPACSVANGGTMPKTASIRARPSSSRITATEMQQIFDEKITNGEANSSEQNCHKIYASVAEMKRSKSNVKSKENTPTLHKDFHSSPDLKELEKSVVNNEATTPIKTKESIKSLSQENINKLRGNARHSWASLSPGAQKILDRNYENSWRSIEKIPNAAEEKKTHNKETTESEGSIGSSSGSESEGENGNKKKVAVLAEAEYRTIKPLRPIQSKTLPRRASTGCTLGPLEQQTIVNLVPPGQMVKVDVSKSQDYASLDISSTLKRKDSNSVMSSFKPKDSAKLYAVPDDIRSIGYRETQSEYDTNGKPSSKSGEDNASQSKMDYAKPDVVCVKHSNQDSATESRGINLRPVSAETSDKRKPETDNEFDPNRSLQEAKERLKPVLKGSSSANINADGTKIRIEVKQSPKLARKPEKTVTFQSEIAQSQPSNSNQGQMSHSLSVDEFQKIKSNLKGSKSFPNDLGQDDGDGNSSSGVSSDGGPDASSNMNISGTGTTKNYVTSLPVNPDSDSSEDSSDKTWILKEGNGQVSDADLPPPPPSMCSLNSTQALKRVVTQANAQIQESQISNGVPSHSVLTKQPQQDAPTYAPVNRVIHRPPPGGNLTKNAVSLTKLPPPMELESESEEKSPILKKTQNTMAVAAPPQPPTSNYHTLQPQRSRSMLDHQAAISTRQQMQYQQLQGPTRQAEKSIEESLQLIKMHVAALKQDFPSAPTPTPEYTNKSQTPILAPPPEFSDPRDNYEQATRFTSNDAQMQHFNRQSPLYRTISHTHSSSSSMYSGYPTMTRQQQYQQQSLYQHQLQQQQQQQQQSSQQQLQGRQRVIGQPGQQQQLQLLPQHQMIPQNQMSMSMPQTYHTLGRIPSASYASNSAQNMLNTPNYQTLGSLKSQQPVQHHHPKCMYFYQNNPPSSNANSGGGKYIPEKLHPVNRYTPDICESSGPRIVGTIPKKQVHDHYEIPLNAQQQLMQHQLQQQHLHQQQMQQSQGATNQRVRREFRNKTLPDWTVLDACDWLDSLFMPEYKEIFQERGIDGKKLLRIDNSVLLELGIKKLGHRMNIEKSLKRYLPQPKT